MNKHLGIFTLAILLGTTIGGSLAHAEPITVYDDGIPDGQIAIQDGHYPEVTVSPWVPNKRNKNALTFALINTSSASVSSTYRIVITNFTNFSSGQTEVIYDKTTKFKNLKPGKTKSVSLKFNTSALIKKFEEGSYNAEIYVGDEFLGSTVFSVSDAKSRTATVTVSTPYDGLRLPPGTTLPINIDIAGSLPRGGYIGLAVVSYEKDGNSFWWFGEKTVPPNFTGRVTYQLPFDRAPFGSYAMHDSHYILAKLRHGLEPKGIPISEDGSPNWFYTNY